MKRFKYILAIIISMLFIQNVSAGSISISTSKSAVVGGNITATITISKDVEGWDYVIGYDTSKLRLVSSTLESTTHSVSTYQLHQNSRSYTMTFKTLASGTAKIYVSSADCSPGSCSRGSASVTLKTQAEIEASYSKNNNLASLGIDGIELTTAFNKDTLEYSVELEPDTTKISLTGSVEDKTASVEGLGEREVQDGPNRLEVIVTAQNGSKKTYVINATVKEFDPIKVKVDGVEYTVVRKKSGIGEINGYEATTVDINGTEVPALKSKVTGYTLVALKDEKGNQNYFIKDKDDYILYKEYTFNRVVLAPLPWNKNLIPSNYKKYTITYNDEKLEVYKLNKKSKYALIYGVNVETGVENIYMYDSVEDTLQIYNTEEVKSLTNDKHLYLKLTLGLGVLAFVELIVLISVLVSNKKKNKVKVKQMNQKVE